MTRHFEFIFVFVILSFHDDDFSQILYGLVLSLVPLLSLSLFVFLVLGFWSARFFCVYASSSVRVSRVLCVCYFLSLGHVCFFPLSLLVIFLLVSPFMSRSPVPLFLSLCFILVSSACHVCVCLLIPVLESVHVFGLILVLCALCLVCVPCSVMPDLSLLCSHVSPLFLIIFM